MTLSITTRGIGGGLEAPFRYFPDEIAATGSRVTLPNPVAEARRPTALLWALLRESADSVAQEMARSLRHLRQVERVTVLANSWGFEIWVEGADLSQEQRFQIYDAQYEIMLRWPGEGFDFHLHDCQDGAPSDPASFRGPFVTVPLRAHEHA